jgi:hypothetical protein
MLVRQIVDDLPDTLRDGFVRGEASHFRIQRRLIGCIDAGEAGKVPGTGTHVEALGIALLADSKRCIHEDLAKASNCRPWDRPHGSQGRDRGYQHRNALVIEKPGKVCEAAIVFQSLLAAEAKVSPQFCADPVPIQYLHTLPGRRKCLCDVLA